MNAGNTSLYNLARLGNGIKSRRISSHDPYGSNYDFLVVTPGETVTIGEIEGAGIIRHIWMTTGENSNILRGLALRMYWDGEDTPSVQCPLGDFFGLGHGKAAYMQSAPLQCFYLGMNCWFPMPFSKGAKITVTNDAKVETKLYYYIDYHEMDQPSSDLARFHACWRRSLVTKAAPEIGPAKDGVVQNLNATGKDNYVVLDAEGKGHYVGCVLHIDTNEAGWWGEGDDMIFIDGEPWPPRLHGTGTEDYFCGAWNYRNLHQTYCTPYFGYHFKGNSDYTGKHSQYRFHIEDPIFFEKSILVTLEHGHANDKQGDWSSTAYWYQIGRKKPLPDLKDFAYREPYRFGGLEWPGKDRKELPL